MNKPSVTIVLPTFNEQHNVVPIVQEIDDVFWESGLTFEIIFVDDSNDETPDKVRSLMRNKPYIKLIHRSPSQRTGLGTAILAGFRAATADYVCCMDSDLQHPPHTIVEMYRAMQREGKNFAIASRMIDGGSAEGLSSGYRHFVSRISSYVSWFFLPLTKKSSDPMTGFFLLEKRLIENKEFSPIGFKLLVEFLARVPAIDSIDVPFVMRKREYDESKASFREGLRYLKHVVKLVFDTPADSVIKYVFLPIRFLYKSFFTLLGVAAMVLGVFYAYTFTTNVIEVFFLTISLFLSAQLIYITYVLVYAWDHPGRMKQNASPEVYLEPTRSFTAVVPALNEAEVIPHTIRAVANIDYPEHLKETLVVLRDTDTETIAAAQKTIDELQKPNVRIQLISGEPFNKNHHLNSALQVAKKDVICIFDAEDEPNAEIYNVVNTVMVRDSADVVQSGVQLMNYDSNWYSLFNVLEYFLWFGSALHFYEKQGVIPLGGNTVFFDTAMVRELGGWDPQCLTEDADIGIKLSVYGANIRVVYDVKHSTQEETPPTLTSFIKQRTRWGQGFMQILRKRSLIKDVSDFGFKKMALIWYILGWPRVHAVLFLYMPIAVLCSFFIKTHPVLTIINVVPILFLLVFLVVQNVALYEFTKIYNKKWSVWLIPKTIFWFIPYQVVLSYCSFRAMLREYKQQTSWEKTEHINAHRKVANEVV